MKVMHVAEATIGGVASHLLEILPLQVDVIGKGNVSLLIPESSRGHIPNIAGLHIETFPATKNRMHSSLILARRLREICRRDQPDVVHAHSSFGGLAARMLRGAGSIPVIYCPHAWSFTQDIATWKKHVYALVERVQLRRTKFVVNVSHYERTIALNFGIPDHGKLLVIENGIAKSNPPTAFPVPEMNPGYLNLAFIGRSNRQKGLDLLIEAARTLEGEKIVFHLVGPSKEQDPEILSGIPSNMIVYGWQPREFALALIEKVDGLVMPSRWEGLPMIGLEAMRASKAIIASDRTALPELVDDGVTGILVDIDRHGALASILRETSRAALAKMGKAGRRKFEERYVAEVQIEKFIHLYKESCRHDAASF